MMKTLKEVLEACDTDFNTCIRVATEKWALRYLFHSDPVFRSSMSEELRNLVRPDPLIRIRDFFESLRNKLQPLKFSPIFRDPRATKFADRVEEMIEELPSRIGRVYIPNRLQVLEKFITYLYELRETLEREAQISYEEYMPLPPGWQEETEEGLF